MSYRSSLNRTLSGSLESKQDFETNVDRLTAFSLATRLGTLLQRLRYAMDSTCHTDALAALRQAAGVSREAADCALHEWLGDTCRRCGGAATIMVQAEGGGEKPLECPSCQGHPGKHRFSDMERASYLRVSLAAARRMQAQIRRAHEVIGTADRQVNSTMAKHLQDE